MTEHLLRKHAFAAISDRDEYRRLLERCALTSDDAKLMELLYVKRMDLACAADIRYYRCGGCDDTGNLGVFVALNAKSGGNANHYADNGDPELAAAEFA